MNRYKGTHTLARLCSVIATGLLRAVTKELGVGAFGSVSLGINKSTGEKVSAVTPDYCWRCIDACVPRSHWCAYSGGYQENEEEVLLVG